MRRGYRHVTELMPPPQRTGVLIAARRRFVERMARCARDVAEPYRLVDVDLGVVRLTGVYMPNLLKKVPYWQTLVRCVRRARGWRRAGDRRLQHLPRLCR